MLARMDQLRGYIDKGAFEVQQIQPLLERNLWLLNPKWTEADGQTTYTDWLRQHCTEPKDYSDEERRIDILGISAGGGLTVVEIKRPDKTLSRRDLEQVAQYVDWARNQFGGQGPHSPKYINGLLVVGRLSNLGDVQQAMKRLMADDIRAETYRDLHQAAQEYYGHAKQVLKHIAPEYAKAKEKPAERQPMEATSKGTRKKAVGKKSGPKSNIGRKPQKASRKATKPRP